MTTHYCTAVPCPLCRENSIQLPTGGTFSNVLTEPMAPSIDKLREAARQIKEASEREYLNWQPELKIVPPAFIPKIQHEESKVTTKNEALKNAFKQLEDDMERQFPSLTERVGIRKIEGEWVDTKEKPVTKYLDKHGTEIREGDTVQGQHGPPFVATHPNVLAWPEGLVALSRADGTPVYRYKGGEDVRDLDDFLFPDGGEGRCYDKYKGQEYWSACTLIRRAGENQLNAAIREATKPTPRCVACGSETYLCGQDGRCPECTPKTIAEAREQKTQWFVRDDPENLKKAAAVKFVGVDWSGEVLAEAIDRFADWLNQPTLSQRFEAFRSRVEKRIASAKFVTAVFDCDSRSGPTVRLEIQPGLSAMDSWCIFYEPATDKDIANQLNAWSKSLGQEVVRGRLKVSK